MRLPWTLVFFVAALAAQAQNGPGQGQASPEGSGRGRFPGPNVGFTTVDTNGDGTLDASEIAAAPKALAKLDKNSDGQITSDEVRMAMPQRQGRSGPGGERGPESGAATNIVEDTVKTLMAFDANSDGKLSKSELPERFQGMFARGDENKDGILTPEEIQKMATAQARPPETAGPGGRGGRGGGPPREINFIRMDPILTAVDTNGDGIISAEELRNSAASLKKLDKDGDGYVTREEARPATSGREF